MRVRVVPGTVTYDPGTRVFSVGLSVQNLLVQQLGTADGPTLGFRLFMNLIGRTGGSGALSILNPDGVDDFTGVGQPYFQYDAKLPTLAVSSPRIWQFSIHPNVTSWRFGVYVSGETMPVVVFDREVDGNRDIWRVGLDGSDLVRLTDHSAADLDPTVAADRVVFVSYRTGNADLHTMHLAGGSQSRIVSNPANQLSPALNWNATRLAYIDDRTGVPKVYVGVIEPLTGVLRNNRIRTAGEGNAASPEASPAFFAGATNQIAFVGTHQGTAGIYALQFPGNATPLVTHAAADVEPAFSPDGRFMAFTSTRDGNPEIYVRTLSSGSITRVTNFGGYDGQPAFLPDNRIVYVSDVGGTRQLRMYDPGSGLSIHIPTGSGTPRNPAVATVY